VIHRVSRGCFAGSTHTVGAYAFSTHSVGAVGYRLVDLTSIICWFFKPIDGRTYG